MFEVRRNNDIRTSDTGLRLPDDCWISPSLLRTYSVCPRQVQLKYIDKCPGRKRFSVSMINGVIAHSVLQHGAVLASRRRPLPDAETVYRMVLPRLPHQEFPSPDARAANARDVVRYIGYGLSYLDPDATYLRIEKPDHRVLTGGLSSGRRTLSTRPDLILLRTDATNGPYIEFVDYKTGRRHDDPLVPVFARFVFRELIGQYFADPSTARVRFTYLWLERGETQTYDLTREFCYAHWPEVLEAIETLVAERDWIPRPSHLCNSCRYNGNACTAGMRRKFDPFSS